LRAVQGEAKREKRPPLVACVACVAQANPGEVWVRRALFGVDLPLLPLLDGLRQ
jgi:hypothetical protein